MYAIVGTSELDPARGDEGVEILKNGVLPGISQAPGFVSATFARSSDGTKGRSMIIFETEEAAKAVAASAGERLPEGAPIEIVSLEVYEVMASA